MESSGKPVPKNVEKMLEAWQQSGDETSLPLPDFTDTATAFAVKSDQQLEKAARLFGLMNYHWLVGMGSMLGLAAIRLRMPFVESVVKNTIFEQFCAGTTLLDSAPNIQKLHGAGVYSALDYGVEAKETEDDFNHTMNEIIRAIEFSEQCPGIHLISVKITGLARFALLESVHKKDNLGARERNEYKNVLKRIDAICHTAAQKGISVFIDAEESWIQDAIDHLATLMMARYNHERAVVYNTFQMYRTDRLQFLIRSYNRAAADGYVLGAKLVRGAYMEKERDRAERLGYESPIHPNKEATDHSFDTAVRFCMDHYEKIAFCNASHNASSAMLQAELIRDRNLPRQHPHLLFCQLYGMSDNLTFNLAKAGYNAGKYVVYGPVREVVPFLIRRAQENTTVTGDMSREHQLVTKELKRREGGAGS
jgi:proline dehydrogenase